MASVTFSTTIGGDGSTITDDTDPFTGLDGGGHRARFVPALEQMVAVAEHIVGTAGTVNEESVAAVEAAAAAAQSAVDAASVVPVGGTTGQVLAKASDTDLDTAWVDQGGVGAVAWDDVTSKPTTFPPTAHGHAIADVTGLQTALERSSSPTIPAFVSKTDATVGALTESNAVTVGGVTTTVWPALVRGDGAPEMQVNAGPWSTSAIFRSGDTLKLRNTAAVAETNYVSNLYTVGATASWTLAAVVPAVAPVITGVPTIGGTAEVGQTLTATAASVTGTPTPTRTWQWERNGAAISGATAATYMLVTADGGTSITVVQTETNIAGFDDAESAAAAVAGLVYTSFDTLFWTSAIQDPTGFVGSGVDINGKAMPFALPPRTMPTARFQCSFVPFYGQSLSVGGSGFPALSTENSTTDEMWVQGMRPEDDYPAGNASTWYASIVPAKEAISPRYASQGETPARGFADAFRGIVTAYYGSGVAGSLQKFHLSAPGQGGIEIVKLLKGDVSGYYARILAQMDALVAQKSGVETVGMEIIPFIHGERDYLLATTKAAYKTRLTTLCADINADAKTKFGQTSDVQVIGTQVASHIANANQVAAQIALAQAECDDEVSNYHLACPMYFFPFKGTDVHLSALGYVWLGAYIAHAHKVVNVDRTALTIVKPLSYSTAGNTVEITYSLPTVDDLANGLVWDTTTIPAQTNYGFRLFDSSGAQQAISSVALTSTNKVTITAAAPITAGSYIDYACQGDATKGLGNLRDNAGSVIRAQVPNFDLPLHNWALISVSGALI